MAPPRQKPRRSEQVVQTPPEFLLAVEGRFGTIAWDLAADSQNRVCHDFYGPGSPHGEDALTQDWTQLRGTLWLNPQFGNIAPFAQKASACLACVKLAWERRNRHDWRVPMLTPAGVSTRWFDEHVIGQALVLALQPRIRFTGHAQDFPKDLILSVYGLEPGFQVWRWRD